MEVGGGWWGSLVTLTRYDRTEFVHGFRFSSEGNATINVRQGEKKAAFSI